MPTPLVDMPDRLRRPLRFCNSSEERTHAAVTRSRQRGFSWLSATVSFSLSRTIALCRADRLRTSDPTFGERRLYRRQEAIGNDA